MFYCFNEDGYEPHKNFLVYLLKYHGNQTEDNVHNILQRYLMRIEEYILINKKNSQVLISYSNDVNYIGCRNIYFKRSRIFHTREFLHVIYSHTGRKK
jgi:Uma2 family endonuclease